MFMFKKKSPCPRAAEALPGPRRRRSRPRRSTSSTAARSRGPIRRASRRRCSAWAASGAPSASSGSSATASTSPRSAMPAGHTPNPTYRGSLQRPHRPQRGRAGGLRSEEDFLRAAAQDVLGEPRPDPGHAPGQRRRHPVPLRHLRVHAGAAQAAEASKAMYEKALDGEAATTPSPPRSSTRRRSISPRTTTSNTSPRTRWAIAGSAAPA